MIRKIKIQKPKMPISLNNCDDAINEILDYEKLEEAFGADRAWAGFAHVAANVTESYFL